MGVTPPTKFLSGGNIVKNNEIKIVKNNKENCNCCFKSSGSIDRENEVYDVVISHNNRSITISLCRSCLSILGDKIWDVL